MKSDVTVFRSDEPMDGLVKSGKLLSWYLVRLQKLDVSLIRLIVNTSFPSLSCPPKFRVMEHQDIVI